MINKENFKFGLGLSAKIRDAGVSLKNSELLRENFSIGFAPTSTEILQSPSQNEK